jgi:hypothetical protein
MYTVPAGENNALPSSARSVSKGWWPLEDEDPRRRQDRPGAVPAPDVVRDIQFDDVEFE